MNDCSYLELNTGAKLPTVGLGLWKIENDRTAEMVYEAIKLGYRHLDAACDYGNEREAGLGIQRALKEGICTREELWITSKLWNTYHRDEHVLPAIERTLAHLQVDYLDLYLVHFPIALQFVPFEERYPPGWAEEGQAMRPISVSITETWSAMERLHDQNLAKHIGVCNFGCSLIRELLAKARVRPSVLQVESHPYLVQPKLLRFCQQENIVYTAFSPLGAGSYVPLGMASSQDSVLQNAVVGRIAQAHGKTPAQVVLRWGIQRGTAVIPKTSQVGRLQENRDLGFELTVEEMEEISSLDQQRRFNDPGEFCESAFGCFFPIYE